MYNTLLKDKMDLKQIREMAEKDLPIDETSLDKESLNVPRLHNKYLNILHDEKLLLQKYRIDFRKLQKLKWEYYTGKIDEETLKEKGWEPFALRILKQDVELYMNADEDLVVAEGRMEYQQEKVNYLESIIKGLNTRQYHIRDAISWKKFVNGVV
jgi:hypothetical protein